MAQNVGNATQARRNAPIQGSPEKTTENRFEALVAGKIEDGKLSEASIKSLASEITPLQHPRERAHQKKDLRAAIRNNPDLSPAERREAITSLNKEMALVKPAWAAARATDVAGEASNPAEQSATERTLGAAGADGPIASVINPELNRARSSKLLLSNMPIRA